MYDCESTYDGQTKIVGAIKDRFSSAINSKPQTNTLFPRRIELLKERLLRDILTNLEANFKPEQAKQLGMICSIETKEDKIKNAKPLSKLLNNYFEVNIKISPLRERKGEIIPIAYDYIQYHNKENNRKILGITPKAEKLLLSYDWPGNFDELYSELERAVTFTKDSESIKPSSFSQMFLQR